MHINHKQNYTIENKLYNRILLLSRNKILYTKFALNDTFQNRINLIFLHMSFLLNKFTFTDKSKKHKEFNQKLFDLTFKKIEENMREIGYGDVLVNKNMKSLIKIFYNIVLNTEKYSQKKIDEKNKFLLSYLSLDVNKKRLNNIDLSNYFDKYQAFCFDLCLDSVVKGDLNFTYK